jgi:protein-L-isoaspartate O-methyltransferase
MVATLEATSTFPATVRQPSARVLAITFAGTIFVSAFLLFQVQPLVSKAILPWFGGSPAVWTTCMLFFQVLLFCGYAYAHALTRFTTPRTQLALHVLLLAAALAFLPILPSADWKPEDGSQPTWRILTLLFATVGLPYFLLSTTGPLVQAWFARTFEGKSPYRLYALSNVGSLLALLTFPFVFEPALELGSLSSLWSIGFVVFAILCAVSAYRSLLQPSALRERRAENRFDRTTLAAPKLWQRLIWVALPAWASMMLLATTNHVCQDVAVVPFLWVAPLSIYLLSFIISFDHPRWYSRSYYSAASAVMLLALAGIDDWPYWVSERLYEPFELSFTVELVIYFACLYLICMLCHGELARMQPHPKYLTEYFLMMSAGGALGGLFVSIVAPRIFDTFFEWKLGLWGSFAIACVLAGLSLTRAMSSNRPQLRPLVAVGTAGVIAAGTALMVYWQNGEDPALYMNRNFYGRVAVYDYDQGTPRAHRTFKSGRIAHGRQFTDPDKRHIPIAYYGPTTGAGRVLSALKNKPDARVGVVGMGAGTMVAFAEPGHYYRVYEINPEVKYIAENYFTYLKDCKGECDIVLGDARLALEREEPNDFDVLCLDAFSGDAVPTHLLTDEAFEIYTKHLKPDGIIVFNITNSYLNLVPVVEGLAENHGYKWTRFYIPRDSENLIFRTDYMLVTRNEEFLRAHPPEVPEDRLSTLKVPLWTDRYNNIFQLLR